jgi:hypothetical protein
MHIFLALRDADGFLLGDRLPDLGEVIGHRVHALEILDPALLPVGSLDPEVFRPHAHHLVQYRTLGVGIVVGGIDLRLVMTVAGVASLLRARVMTRSAGAVADQCMRVGVAVGMFAEAAGKLITHTMRPLAVIGEEAVTPLAAAT